MSESAISKVIKERRSIKKGYNDKTVEEETVRNILNNVIYDTTHGMREPWRFIFIDKNHLPNIAKKVAATYEKTMKQKREDYLKEPNAILVAIMQKPEME